MDLKNKPFYLDEEGCKWVDKTLSGMTVDEKIGQLFCLITYTDDENYLNYLTKKLKIGGIMCRTMSFDELVNTVNTLQSNSKIPLLISANLEAGLNQLVTDGLKIGSEMALAATGDKKYAKELARIIAEEAAPLGVNWSFSPIIDIDLNYHNPITNTRTFGNNKETVAAFANEYIKEIQKEGMAATIKHFPGDGVDERDQHLLASINSLSKEEWDETYGYAYKSCIDAGVKSVMVGHIMQPAYSKYLDPSLKDEDIKPGLISKELLNGLLRKRLGFNGLIITDSTTMAGLSTVMSREKAVPLTIASGCDMFLFTKNLEEDFAFMKKGVEDGTISKERLDEAVKRILALKASLELHKKNNLPDIAKAKANTTKDEHKQIAKEIAQKSITLVKEEKEVLPLKNEKYKRILVYKKESGSSSTGGGASLGACDRFVELLKEEGFAVDIFKSNGGWEGMAKPVKEVSEQYDLIIYIVSLATKSNQTTVRLEWAEPMGADVPIFINEVPTIMISLENPYHLLDAPRVKTYINTYGGSEFVLKVLIDKLMGRDTFVGKSPVDAFCGKWDTRL